MSLTNFEITISVQVTHVRGPYKHLMENTLVHNFIGRYRGKMNLKKITQLHIEICET